MSKIERIFKKEIPDDLMNKFLNVIGLSDIYDNKWIPTCVFTKDVCSKLDEIIIEIAPYYQDHKSYLVTREMNTRRYIQVLRHLAKSKEIVLESKSYGASKGTYYRLLTNKISEAEYTISFV